MLQRLFVLIQYSTTSENPMRKEILAYHNCRIYAGLSGTTAVMIAVYGANVFAGAANRDTEDLKKIFVCGSIVHFIHSAVLLAAPLTMNPKLVSLLMISGIITFSGSCYNHALRAKTKINKINKITPILGAVLLGLSWIVMVF